MQERQSRRRGRHRRIACKYRGRRDRLVRRNDAGPIRESARPFGKPYGMKRTVLALRVIVLVLIALLVPVQSGIADSSRSASDEVIALEARWINAILIGNRNTVAAILSEHFKHITNDGAVVDRAQELASIKKEPFKIALSEQTVDLNPNGDSAVLHGLDTITQPGKARETPTIYRRFLQRKWHVAGSLGAGKRHRPITFQIGPSALLRS